MASLASQYPHLTAALALYVKDWASLSPDERNAWITEALSNADDGRDEIEVAARYSATGNSRVVSIRNELLAEVGEAMLAARQAERAAQAMVATAASAVGVQPVAEVACVTRQTVYRWMRS